MNPGERPSQRLRLLPVAVVLLCGSAIVNMVVVSGDASTSRPRMLVLLLVLADLAKVIGIVTLAGYVLARVLEQWHLWRASKVEPSGRDWYEA